MLKHIFVLSLVLCIALVHGLIPQPYQMERLDNRKFVLNPSTNFITDSKSSLLLKSLERYKGRIFSSNDVASKYDISEVILSVRSDSEILNMNTDESYVLRVSENSVDIFAETVFGAKHALETLSQLVEKDESGDYTIEHLNIIDEPRFKWRGLLLDTARHFMTVPSILSTLDGMEAAKYNVFHWHIVDAESFPMELKSNPILAEKGAYDSNSTYSREDIDVIIEYAKERGMRTVMEVDVPGHVASWGKGEPSIVVSCPKYEHNLNNIPLNPIVDRTYEVVETLFKEVASFSDEEFIHTGGDEVVFGCFNNNTEIVRYMRENGISNPRELVINFEKRLDTMLSQLKRKKIIWQDMFGYGAQVNPSNTIVQLWNDRDTLKPILQRGIRAIISNGFYISNLGSWQSFYQNDPYQDGLTPREKDLIVGGEACVWAEYIDSDVLDSVVWPRGTAIGERLWSPESVRDVASMKNRLMKHTCHLKRRGVKSVPVAPGHCNLN